MEYLREEAIEKEEEGETATSRIETIEVEESQPVEVWSEQKRKVSWIDWIKTIGKQNCIYTFPTYMFMLMLYIQKKFCFRNKSAARYRSHHCDGLWCNCGNVLHQLK